MGEDERGRPKRKAKPHHVSCGKGEAIEEDEAIGSWPKEELKRMDQQFQKALAAVMRKGQ